MTIFRAEYCPDCGSKLTTRWEEDGSEKQPYCEQCGRMIWQQPIPCADTAVIDGEQVLLIKRTNPPHVGKWALPGGIMDINESPEEAAARELREEASIDVDPTALELLGTYAVAASEGWHNIGISYVVERDNTSGMPTPSTDAQEARFWPLQELHASEEEEIRPEPDDESRIRKAIDRIRKKRQSPL
jgi:8-oxo-dGTP diphosphatase